MGTSSPSDPYGTAFAAAPGKKTTNIFNSIGLGGMFGSPKLRIPYPNIKGYMGLGKGGFSGGGGKTPVPTVVSANSAVPGPRPAGELASTKGRGPVDFNSATDPLTLAIKETYLKNHAPKTTSGGSGGSGGGGGGAAYALAQLQLKAAGQPYDRAIDQLGKDYANNKSQAILGGKRQDADLAALFSRLGNYETDLKAKQQENYRVGGLHLQDAYDKLTQGIQDSYKQGVGNTTAELARLGIQQVSPAAMAGLAKDGSYLTNQTAIDKVNAVTNNNANSQTFRDLMQEMIGSAGAEGTSQRGKAKQATADALNSLMQQYAKDKAELSGKKADALLQARMSAMQAQQAAASRASSRGSSLADKIAYYDYTHKNQASTKGMTPYDLAMQRLTQLTGPNDPGRLKDYSNELQFLMSQDWKSSMNPKDANPLAHLQNYWGSKKTYGAKGINDLMQALGVYTGTSKGR